MPKPKTIQDHKDAAARYRRGLRIGSEVRLKGWQMHWPQLTAKILSISSDREHAIVSPPICGRVAWSLYDLAKPF